jgi:hypothetical protein
MASLAVPVLEGAGLALARALGYGAATAVGGAAINEAAKRKAKAAEEAKAAPLAQAGTQTKTNDSCKKCPPDCGTLVERNWNMSEDARAYQSRITGFVPYTEWNFNGDDFDGFKSQMCLLLEAKARYDQFFDLDGTPKLFFRISGTAKIMAQAERQADVIWANPPAQLHWHFMQPISFSYFSKRFGQSLLPIQCLLTP